MDSAALIVSIVSAAAAVGSWIVAWVARNDSSGSASSASASAQRAVEAQQASSSSLASINSFLIQQEHLRLRYEVVGRLIDALVRRCEATSNPTRNAPEIAQIETELRSAGFGLDAILSAKDVPVGEWARAVAREVSSSSSPWVDSDRLGRRAAVPLWNWANGEIDGPWFADQMVDGRPRLSE